jgi:hypothetical protein
MSKPMTLLQSDAGNGGSNMYENCTITTYFIPHSD